MLPLEGIRVLDLSIMYAGPGTTMYLGNMGADVIKVESHAGDDSRALGTTPYLGRNSRNFQVVNRDKRAIVLDARQPQGREIIQRLARRSDVLLHNFRPGVAERLGIDFATLSAINPRLIYAWVTAFGSRGPYADKPAYDRVIQGYAGVLDLRQRRDGEPTSAGMFFSDTSVPMLLSYAIGAALYTRERTGRGQLLEVSLLGLALAMQSAQWVRVEQEPRTEGDTLEDDVLERACPILRCSDGAYLVAALVQDAEWRAFCRAIGEDGLAADARFATLTARVRSRTDLDQALAPVLATRPRAAWLEVFAAAGVPAAPLLSRNEVMVEPQVVENGMIAQVMHPSAGRTRMMSVPVHLSETPGAIRRAAPEYGQDTDAILHEAGYAADEISALRTSGIVA